MDDAREVPTAAEEDVDEQGAAAPVHKEMEMGGKGDQPSEYSRRRCFDLRHHRSPSSLLKISFVPLTSTLAQWLSLAIIIFRNHFETCAAPCCAKIGLDLAQKFTAQM